MMSIALTSTIDALQKIQVRRKSVTVKPHSQLRRAKEDAVRFRDASIGGFR